eukprot:scaffold4407_cov172-Pinguiococcus_pyrenoidosus.AAC.1
MSDVMVMTGKQELFLPEDHVNLEQVTWDEDTGECLQRDQIRGRDVLKSYSTPSVIYNTSRCRTIRSAKSASCSACERTEWRRLPSKSSLHGQATPLMSSHDTFHSCLKTISSPTRKGSL